VGARKMPVWGAALQGHCTVRRPTDNFALVKLLERLYDTGLSVLRPAIERGARSDRSRRAINGRRQTLDTFARWARESRDRSLPLIWFHAPSVGESLMASAIIAELRQRRSCQVAFTFFSPSAERMAPQVGADVSAYLPWDTPRDVRRSLDELEPAALVFVRTEIWPGLVREAKHRGIRVALVNAPLAESSSRLRLVARTLLRNAYGALDAVGAVSEADGSRFGRLGVSPAHTIVTGDARFDQVAARVDAIDRDAEWLRRFLDDEVPVIVAGSTWPADEDRLIPAVAALRTKRPVRLIVAPHEPTPDHLGGLEARLDRHGLSHTRLSALVAADPLPDAIVVDRTGVLADLYAVGRVAYVGGGFGRNGLHSVIEPAALGIPVVSGPRPGNSTEAVELREAGGAAIAETADAIRLRFDEWLDDVEAGRRARVFVEAHLGGAARNAELVAGLLPTVDIPYPEPTGGQP
jgi:3-deoxy-D-manno-octulosonic-acid transferase